MLTNRYLDIELECGVDESGAGCAFGPVVAAAVILPPNWSHPLLNDSKKVSEKNRKILYDEIIKSSITYSICEVDSDTIDQINILQARFLAMSKCIQQLNPLPEHILIDGDKFYKSYEIPYTCVVKGDAKFTSIAAASILAKVYRDNMMVTMSENYNKWNVGKHKGYLTKEHIELINKWGISEQHRKSFLKNYTR